MESFPSKNMSLTIIINSDENENISIFQLLNEKPFPVLTKEDERIIFKSSQKKII